MKFQIKKETLQDALSFVSQPIIQSQDETLSPSVRSVFVRCTETEIEFFGTNLKIMFTNKISSNDDLVKIDDPGECLIYSKSLLQLIQKFSSDVWVSFDSEKVKTADGSSYTLMKVTCKSSEHKIQCGNVEEYPLKSLTISKEENTVSLDGGKYLEAIRKISTTCGRDPARYDLYNLCLEFDKKDQKLYFVGSSGFNLAVFSVENEVEEDKQLLLRKDVLVVDPKYYNADNSVEIIFGKNALKNDLLSVRHKIDDSRTFQIFAVPIMENFPNWKLIYNAEPKEGKIVVGKKTLSDSLDRVRIVSPFLFILNAAKPNKIELAADSENSKMGNSKYKEEVEVSEQSLNCMNLMNTTLLRESLLKIPGDIVELRIINLGKTSLFKVLSPSLSSYQYFQAIIDDSVEEDEQEEEYSEEVERDFLNSDEEVPF